MSKLTDKIEAAAGYTEMTLLLKQDAQALAVVRAWFTTILADARELEDYVKDYVATHKATQSDIDVLVGTAREQGKAATREAKREAYEHAIALLIHNREKHGHQYAHAHLHADLERAIDALDGDK